MKRRRWFTLTMPFVSESNGPDELAFYRLFEAQLPASTVTQLPTHPPRWTLPLCGFELLVAVLPRNAL